MRPLRHARAALPLALALSLAGPPALADTAPQPTAPAPQGARGAFFLAPLSLPLGELVVEGEGAIAPHLSAFLSGAVGMPPTLAPLARGRGVGATAGLRLYTGATPLAGFFLSPEVGVATEGVARWSRVLRFSDGPPRLDLTLTSLVGYSLVLGGERGGRLSLGLGLTGRTSLLEQPEGPRFGFAPAVRLHLGTTY
jgi:hypothetical protein